MLRFSHVGITFMTTCGVCRATIAIGFCGFGFAYFIRKVDLGVGRVVAKEGHSLFGGLQLSTQAKRCEMRPCPASKKTEGEELD